MTSASLQLSASLGRAHPLFMPLNNLTAHDISVLCHTQSLSTLSSLDPKKKTYKLSYQLWDKQEQSPFQRCGQPFTNDVLWKKEKTKATMTSKRIIPQ